MQNLLAYHARSEMIAQRLSNQTEYRVEALETSVELTKSWDQNDGHHHKVRQNLELHFINDLCWMNVSKCIQKFPIRISRVTLNQNQYL